MANLAHLPDLTGLDKTAQLAALRARMSSIPSRRDHAPTDLVSPPSREQVLGAENGPTGTDTAGTDTAGTDTAGTVAVSPRPFSSTNATEPSGAPQRTQTLRTIIPVPVPLAELLPRGALARGQAISITGSASILTGVVAAATATGHHVALVGQRSFGFLAAHEQGADVSKLAHVDFSGVHSTVA